MLLFCFFIALPLRQEEIKTCREFSWPYVDETEKLTGKSKVAVAVITVKLFAVSAYTENSK